MPAVGDTATTFTLTDHLGRSFDSASQLGRRHLLLVFYPLDFTPT